GPAARFPSPESSKTPTCAKSSRAISHTRPSMRSIDARTGELKPMPNTRAAVRDVPIEATLLPLLYAMHERAGRDPNAPVVPALRELNDKFRAKLFRDDLNDASCTSGAKYRT